MDRKAQQLFKGAYKAKELFERCDLFTEDLLDSRFFEFNQNSPKSTFKFLDFSQSNGAVSLPIISRLKDVRLEYFNFENAVKDLGPNSVEACFRGHLTPEKLGYRVFTKEPILATKVELVVTTIDPSKKFDLQVEDFDNLCGNSQHLIILGSTELSVYIQRLARLRNFNFRHSFISD